MLTHQNDLHRGLLKGPYLHFSILANVTQEALSQKEARDR